MVGATESTPPAGKVEEEPTRAPPLTCSAPKATEAWIGLDLVGRPGPLVPGTNVPE